METAVQKLSLGMVEKTVPLKRVADLLCGAFEGGSNYWYSIEKFIKPKEVEFRFDKGHVFRHLDYPLNPGGALLIGTLENDVDAKNGLDDGKYVSSKKGKKGAPLFILDLNTIKEGLKIMERDFPSHYMDWVLENDDANTGDVFLQCCLFGTLIFG